MKKFKILLIALILFSVGCSDLNLNPLSSPSSENWYTNSTEIEMAVNDLYRKNFWMILYEYNDPDLWTDDFMARTALGEVVGGTMNGESSPSRSIWTNTYKAIARANTILANLDENTGNLSDQVLDKYKGEVRFLRACMYSRLISFYGDVPFYEGIMDIEEAFTLSRTNKSEILTHIYADFDFAASKLPAEYTNSEAKRATKGAALAMKARIALYESDWATARDASKACIDLGVYQLYPNYRDLFLSKTKNTKEEVFAIPQSVELGVYIDYCKRMISRNAGGVAQFTPTWDLFFSYVCTDGLPVDKSPLFNPRDPYKNRDPRCTEVAVPIGEEWLGFKYEPHIDSLKILNFTTGKLQNNNDSRGITQFASYNGIIRKKGVDEDWIGDQKTDPTIFVVRYADVLLMYAESKVELGSIDNSVLDALNQVRARAYKVNASETSKYPAITETNQAKLRNIVRLERRMELALEGLRYQDIIRWRLAEKVLTINNYGLLDNAALKSKVISQNLWFFPGVPKIDEEYIPNFDHLYEAGLVKLLSKRLWDPERQYLWPIPSKEILINKNLVQNPGY